jgi:uncharacterized protein
MKLNGSQTIPASRETVWKGLNDPAVLKQCIPGCDSLTQESPTDLNGTIKLKIGPVTASFSGKVTLSDLNPPESYRISGQGQGGLAGFASGGANVKLTAISANETQMDYDVDAQIGGKLAMLGSRLIDSTAQSLAQQFFTKFASLMKAQAAPAPATVAKKVEKAPTGRSVKEAPAKKKAPKKKAVAKKPAAKKPAAKKKKK